MNSTEKELRDLYRDSPHFCAVSELIFSFAMTYLKSVYQGQSVSGRSLDDIPLSAASSETAENFLHSSRAEITYTCTALMTKRKATQGHLVAMGNHQTTQRSPRISRPRAAWALDSFIELYLPPSQISHCVGRQAEVQSDLQHPKWSWTPWPLIRPHLISHCKAT